MLWGDDFDSLKSVALASFEVEGVEKRKERQEKREELALDFDSSKSAALSEVKGDSEISPCLVGGSEYEAFRCQTCTRCR